MSLYEKLLSQNNAVKQSWERLNTNIERPHDLYGYDIGIHPLNMKIGGITPTRVTVVGGRSGTGKSAILTSMAEAALRRKADGSRLEYLFFTWELDPSIVIDRSICSKVGLTLRELNQGAKLLSEMSMTKIKTAYSEIAKVPIIYQMYSTNISEVLAYARDFVKACREKSEIEGAYVHPVVVIDYLNMAQFESEGLRTYGIANFMNSLKQFCNHNKSSAIVLAQLSRESDKVHKIPDRADFSDSSAIENAADNLIVIYRPEYHNVKSIMDPETGQEVDSRGKMLVRVLKGRDNGTGDFLINCDIKYFRMWDQAHKWDTKYWEHYHNEDFWLAEFKHKKEVAQIEVPF